MSSKMRRILVAATLATIAVGLGAIWHLGRPFIDIAVAYKAKVLCSEVFVAGRSVGEVSTDLMIDDLRALRWVHATVDTVARMARARLRPLAPRTARYEDATGCVLVPSEDVATRVSGQGDTGRPSRSPSNDSIVPLDAHARGALDSMMAEAFTEPNPARPRRTRAVVILRNGRLVAERYAAGVGRETPMIGWSMTKSVVNALIGIAVREGRLALNSPADISEWNGNEDQRGRITINDLLHMSAGLRFSERQDDPRSALLAMLYGAHDMAAVAINQPLDAPPGARWQYSSGTTLILSRVLRQALGDTAYRSFPRRLLFDPLGLEHAVIETDASGTFVGSSYMYATAREWARFGQLYLQDGVWAGDRLLPAGWVAYTRTAAPAAPPSTYGAHFWLHTPQEYRGPSVPLPPGIFQAVGHEGQFVTIVPSDSVVIVRLGRTRFADAWAHDQFVAAVLTALRP
jgi:CubicO group peptidase (beta-lactamase class C family)